MLWTSLLLILSPAGATTAASASFASASRDQHRLECQRHLAAIEAERRVARFAELGALVETIAELVYRRPMVKDGAPVDTFTLLTLIRRTGVISLDDLAPVTVRAKILRRLTLANPTADGPGAGDDPFGQLLAEYEYFLAMFRSNLVQGEATVASWFLDEMTQRHADFLAAKHAARRD